jgi:hypothetical protein
MFKKWKHLRDYKDLNWPRQIAPETLSQKYPAQNRSGGVAKVVVPAYQV